jgi:DNA-binding GntR family transcriptional regulator
VTQARSQGLEALHAELREMILSGQLAPGSAISQVQLASDLGISRTPLREVLRMLQQEGLVVAEPNRRARVVQLNVQDLEYVYTQRIMLESLGLSITVQGMVPAQLQQIDAALGEMDQSEEVDEWDAAHKRFHESLVAGASGQLEQTIRQFQDRSDSYRRLYAHLLRDVASRRPVSMREHEAIVAACHERDHLAAGERLAKHLGRTVLTLMAELVPEHEPALVRTALQLVVRGDLRLSALEHLPNSELQGRGGR